MAHALAIVVGEGWEALMQLYCIHKEDGTEGEGQFEWSEEGGRFGKPLKLLQPMRRSGLLRLFGAVTHVTHSRRSLLDLDSLRDQFGFFVVDDSGWHEPATFEQAIQQLRAAPGDPLVTAVDFHV